MPAPNRKTVFVAGAAGAIGRVLVRLLVAGGWRVFGTTRSAERARGLEAAGVEPVLLDVFDADALRDALARAQPEAVVHQLTDLPAVPDPARMAGALERNARLREAGTENLVRACACTPVARMVVQSIAFAYMPARPPYREADPLNVAAQNPAAARSAQAVRSMEQCVLGAPFDALVLRYGRLYGPGTWAQTPPAGCAVHVDAAAQAAVLALEHGVPGVYNVAEPGGEVEVEKALRDLGWDPAFRAG